MKSKEYYRFLVVKDWFLPTGVIDMLGKEAIPVVKHTEWKLFRKTAKGYINDSDGTYVREDEINRGDGDSFLQTSEGYYYFGFTTGVFTDYQALIDYYEEKYEWIQKRERQKIKECLLRYRQYKRALKEARNILEKSKGAEMT